MPAMVTPFLEDQSIDWKSTQKLLDTFIAAGCDGVIVAGTNGEGPSLSLFEKAELAKFAAERGEDLKVVIGIASNSLAEVIWLSEEAAKSGVDGLLVMPPNYFKVDELGLIAWYRAVLERAACPIYFYNFPQRIRVEVLPESLGAVADHKLFAGAKDSSGSEANLVAFKKALPKAQLFVGDETLLMQALDLGWTGTISGAANVVPRQLVAIVEAFDRDPVAAAALHAALLPTLHEIRAQAQPNYNKRRLAEEGVISSSTVRLPLLG